MASVQSIHRTVDDLYSDHHGWLLGWMRRRLGGGPHADDLAQDTFVRILSKPEAIIVREPRAFLTTIAQRVLANHYRRQDVERAWLETLSALPESSVPSPEVQAMVLETLLEIARRLDGLPRPVRRAFLLSQLDGLGHAAIAAELRVSVTTVKRYVVRAGQQCYFPED